jgi:sulfate adenylyltransferase
LNHLIPPHGGRLVNLLVDEEQRELLKQEARDWASIDLTPRQLCDLELLTTGGFSPLASFMNQADYESVCSRMQLADGSLWPIPIVLDIPDEVADRLSASEQVALRDPEGVMLACLKVEKIWRRDLEVEAEAVFGTADPGHPGAAALLRSHANVVTGKLDTLQLPVHYDYRELRLTPSELRCKFARLGWRRVMAYQTEAPMQRTHYEMTTRAAAAAGTNLLIHPIVGMSTAGDVDHYIRVSCYQALMPHYPTYMARMSLLPLAARKAGPREGLWHAIINKNHGCTHFLVEAGHAGAGNDSSGVPFYSPNRVIEELEAHQEELGVSVVAAEELVYLWHRKTFVSVDKVPEDARVLKIDGTELQRLLAYGHEIPEWFTFPAVARQLRRAYPPRHSQGFTVFFTGLSGSGKSTIANALRVKLLELGGRGVTLLDGDLVRRNLSSKLGFSKEDRDANIRRIGFVAGEITRAGGVAICAPIAPYDSVRKEVREMITPCGGFILVHVATPLEVCEARDRKGIYAKARKGIIKEFTGISDPYEMPEDAEVWVDTTGITPEEATQEVLIFLEREGYISAETQG